jgi:hypothetical protein
MAYCGPRGIPLTDFLAWEPSDQEAALSWQEHEARRCRGCGRHPDEPARHPHIDVCPGCVELERARKTEDAQVPGAHLHMAYGTPGSCNRCLAEIEANRPRG